MKEILDSYHQLLNKKYNAYSAALFSFVLATWPATEISGQIIINNLSPNFKKKNEGSLEQFKKITKVSKRPNDDGGFEITINSTGKLILGYGKSFIHIKNGATILAKAEAGMLYVKNDSGGDIVGARTSNPNPSFSENANLTYVKLYPNGSLILKVNFENEMSLDMKSMFNQ